VAVAARRFEGVSGAALRNGEDLLETLFLAYRPRLFRLCLGYLKSLEDAEDAVQETFARAAPRLQDISSSAWAYLTAIARNVCIDECRRKSRSAVAPDDDLVSMRPGPEEVALQRRLLSDLRHGLSTRDRTLITLSSWGFSPSEMASRSGRSTNAVNVSLSRARQRARRLRDQVAAWLPIPAWRRLWQDGHQHTALLAGSMLTVLVYALPLIAGAPRARAAQDPISGQTQLRTVPPGIMRSAFALAGEDGTLSGPEVRRSGGQKEIDTHPAFTESVSVDSGDIQNPAPVAGVPGTQLAVVIHGSGPETATASIMVAGRASDIRVRAELELPSTSPAGSH